MRAVAIPLILAALVQDTQAAQTINLNDLGDFDLNDLLSGLGGGGGGKGAPKKKKKASVCPGGQYAAPKVALHLTDNLRANGCGPQGMHIEDEFGLSRCCNAHDICYSFCGTPFSWCEDEFQACLSSVCDAHEDAAGCQETAQGFSSMTKMFGSGFWKKSQTNTCECLGSKSEANERHLETLTEFYAYKLKEEGGDESVAEAVATKTLHKWKGKEGKLYMTLGLKYGIPLDFVKFDEVEAILPDASSISKKKAPVGVKEVEMKEEL